MKTLNIKNWKAEIKSGLAALAMLMLLSAGTLSYARDIDLQNMPLPSGSEVAWRDKPIELNGVSIPSLRFFSKLPTQAILDFYKDALAKDKWEKVNEFPEENNTVFKKKEQYLYVYVFDRQSTRDVYIAKILGSLAACKLPKGSTLQYNLGEDSPGKDLPDVLRYPGSKRKMSFYFPGQGSFLLYEAAATASEVAQFYRRILKLGRWQEDSTLTEEAAEKFPKKIKDSIAILCFSRNNTNLMINAANVPEGLKAPGQSSNRCLIIISSDPQAIALTEGGKE